MVFVMEQMPGHGEPECHLQHLHEECRQVHLWVLHVRNRLRHKVHAQIQQ